MRLFNLNFTDQKNRRDDGPQPINLLKVDFAEPLYLSDRDVTPTDGPDYAGLVKSWGFVDSDFGQLNGGSVLGKIAVADLELIINNSQSPRFSDLFYDDDPLEAVRVTLFQWFGDLADADKEVFFLGVVSGSPEYDEYESRLTLKGIWHKYNIEIGADQLLTDANYPGCAPDDMGLMAGIGYGTLEHVPARCVAAGAVDCLTNLVYPGTSVLMMADTSHFLSAGTLGLGSEQVPYSGNRRDIQLLTGCTITATHYEGDGVFQILSEYVYLLLGHPVSAILDLFVGTFKVTSVATFYTGRPGNEKAGYSGKAVATLPSRITRTAATTLLTDNGLSSADATAAIATIPGTGTITISDTIALRNAKGVSTGSHAHGSFQTSVTVKFDHVVAWQNSTYGEYAYDGNLNTACQLTNTNGYLRLGKAFYEAYSGQPQQIRSCIAMRSDHSGGTFFFEGYNNIDIPTVYGATPGSVTKSEWAGVGSNINTWAKINDIVGQIRYSSGTLPGNWIADVWLEIRYTDDISPSPATGVAVTMSASVTRAVAKGSPSRGGTVNRTGVCNLSGSSVAAVEIGLDVNATLRAWQDDAAGTYTGTPDALIERPDHVFRHLWSYYLGAPLADFEATAAADYFAAKGYAFSLLIDQPIMADALFAKLALQCRSRFVVMPYGVAKLLLRQCGTASSHAIPKEEIKADSVSISRTPAEGLINDLTVRYAPDRTLGAVSATTCRSAIRREDDVSIARYGRRTGDTSQFVFDAVTKDAMAEDVLWFYLDWYGVVRRQQKFAVFLDNLEIEVGDVLDLTYPLDGMAGTTVEVLKTQQVLGDRNRNDHLIVWSVENGARE